MNVKYPVLMLRITPTNFERTLGTEGFGHFPLANYSSVSLSSFIKESFPLGTALRDEDMGTWDVSELDWDGSDSKPELLELVEEMEWFLYGFCRGVLRARALNGSRDARFERSNEATWESWGWKLEVRVAFSDLQFMLGANRWYVPLKESKPSRLRGANGQFVRDPKRMNWELLPFDFRLSANLPVSDS